YLEDNNLNLKIAIMGCVVNGPGEAKDADYGMAGGHGIWVLFKKGNLLRSVKDEEAFDELKKEIEKDII
ncbi:MAG: flavodoxin-dependent (E)-4-hydroxy-3-methylbut-2-enyl-diphosphate synthase, partial [Bacilli bacterium]